MQTIMLIEDDAVMRSLLRTLLELEGFTVAESGSGNNMDQYMDDIRAAQPNLIVMDVHLGTVNGFDLLARMRASEDLSQIRVVISSGMDLSVRCREAEVDGFIMKPYMPDDFLRYISTIIGN